MRERETFEKKRFFKIRIDKRIFNVHSISISGEIKVIDMRKTKGNMWVNLNKY